MSNSHTHTHIAKGRPEPEGPSNPLGKLTNETDFTYGFNAPLSTRLLRIIAKAFVSVFRLNSNSALSTEICQQISPKTEVQFNGQKVIFRSGHGRLKWRAETLHTEEPLMIEWLKSFRSDDVFLDVGANVGTYTIPAALLCELVIAIELDPINVSCLYSNVHYNELYNKIVIVPLAAGKEKSVMEVYYRDFSVGDALQSVGRAQVLPTNQPSPHILRQLCVPIDSLFSDFSLPKPTKIKIDVDGNEMSVLEGSWSTVSTAKEVYYEDNGLDEDIYILNKLVNLGFKVVREVPSSLGSVKSDIARNLLLRKN